MKLLPRLRAACAALTGHGAPPATLPPPSPITPPPSSSAPPSADAARDLARLRLDLQAREAETVKLRAEFARQEQQAAAATQAAGNQALSALLRALAPTLSQLATLRHLAESGREVRAADALKLAAKLEQTLSEQGLERIGEVGAQTAFDPACHQRLSGGDVRDGDPVRVRFVGYRFRGETPVKALVSRVGAEAEPGKE